MSQFTFARATIFFVTLGLASSGRSQEPEPLPLPPPSSKPVKKAETLDSRVVVAEKGPIHEGFAQPGAQMRGKGITAPKAPPLPVNEIAPEPKPEGAGVKIVSIVRGNPARGLPLIHGLYVLLSTDGLTPELVIDGAALTRLDDLARGLALGDLRLEIRTVAGRIAVEIARLLAPLEQVVQR